MINTLNTVKGLFNTSKAFRAVVYTVLGIATFAAAFKLGVNFGEFAYTLIH